METTKKNIESANGVKNTTAEVGKVIVATVPPVTTKAEESTPSTTPPTPKSEKKSKPKSEAQRKAEELQKEMERKQKELSAKRTKFIETLDQINTAEEVLNEDDTFEVTSYRLIFANSSAPSYREENIFKISNRELLLHFVDFIRDKINKKIAEIEAELVK